MRHSAPAGFRMPAEWEPHEATWIAWPHNRADWPGRFAPIPWVYTEIVRKLSRVEKVRIVIQDGDLEKRARRMLDKAGADLSAIGFFHHATDRVWIRDYGPIFIRDQCGGIAVTNWKFNAWAKYNDWRNDDAIPAAIASSLNLPACDTGIVLEGGGIDVNGAGALLTTEECLLSPVQARNPSLSREEIERAFRRYLGIGETIWLENGIAGDDTHGHIDDLARFVSEDTIVVVSEPNKSDANHEALRENGKLLRGTRYRIVELPMPGPLFFQGRRLPASYANFYIANGLVLVPTFNDPADRRALARIAELFPERDVTGIHCTELIWGLGALHCMTQQQPASPCGNPLAAQPG